MAIKNQYDRFMLLIRQFGLLLNKGKTSDQAFESIQQVLPNEYQSEFNILKQLVDPEKEKVRFPARIGPAQTLRELLDYASKSGGNRVQLFKTFYEQFIRFDAAKYISNFDTSSLLTYLIILLMMLSLVTAIYTIYVYPGFEDLFINNAAELPPFTKEIMTGIKSNATLLFVGVISILGFLLYVIFVTKSNLQKLKYFSAPATWIPGLKNIALTYNDYLCLNFLNILMSSGISEETAKDFLRNKLQAVSAKTRIRGLNIKDSGNSVDAIGLAAALGNVQEEINYQILNKRELAIEQYTWFKETLGTLALIIVATIIGTLVIAMYLPIFNMGKIIGG
jgi:type II secretory pathway component PulF